MIVDHSISGRKTLKVAHLSDERIKTLEEKYGQYGFKFRNKGNDFVIKFNRVKEEDIHLLDKVVGEAIMLVCQPK